MLHFPIRDGNGKQKFHCIIIGFLVIMEKFKYTSMQIIDSS